MIWVADLTEVVKAIAALAPKAPEIAVSIDSNQSLVDNYIKVGHPAEIAVA